MTSRPHRPSSTLRMKYPILPRLLSGLDLSTSLDGFGDALDGFFTVVDLAIKNQALIAKIPVIGDALNNAVRFVGDLRDKISDNLQTPGLD